ncbi:filamin-binding LIM protein 1 [Erpetoichthys calabaricus]|uniref:Filamin binding LIM protein 1 n=1 Tax=Erpetoichthys calabaricus TaxID=27687 RepID=A0A8C4S493_ERPCA|nr:filamin-binding LIM protein 1 [Erpetoichthys calabaricus]
MSVASPPKRMVSSVFITLAPPRRAPPITPPQGAELQPMIAQMGSLPNQSVAPAGTRNGITNGALKAEPAGTTRAGQNSLSNGVHPRTLQGGATSQISGQAGQNSFVNYNSDPLLPLPPPPPEEELPAPPPPADVVSTRSSRGLQTVPGQQTNSSTRANDSATLGSNEVPPPAGRTQAALDELWQTLSVPHYEEQEEKEQKSPDICGFCHKEVDLKTPAIEAMKKVYHAVCFTCRTCNHPLAGQLFYNKDGVPICDPCYKATLERCSHCGQVIESRVIRALKKAFHPECFFCSVCQHQIGEERFAVDDNGEVYCLQDYYRKFASECSACKKLIIPGEDGKDAFNIECMGRTFHEACYCCENCGVSLSPEPNEKGSFPLGDRMLCKACHQILSQQGAS